MNGAERSAFSRQVPSAVAELMVQKNDK